jgi:peptidoglycan hydrolase CwlO-like protein
MRNRAIQIKLPYLILFSVVLIFSLYLFNSNSEESILSKYDKQKQEIDSLSKEIGKLETEHTVLNTELTSYQLKIDKLDTKIDATEQELTDTRNYYGKKIMDINSSSPAELNDFFSERYK